MIETKYPKPLTQFEREIHPNVLAMFRTHETLLKYTDAETADSIERELLNNGVVMRMAKWFIENYMEDNDESK